MPLVKVRSGGTPAAEEWARKCATMFPRSSIWRWDATGSRWTEIPCTAAEWFRHDLARGPLPGVPPGPLLAVILFLHGTGPAVPFYAKWTFAIVDGHGCQVEVVDIDPAMEARDRELSSLPKHTSEERAERLRIREDVWRPFGPTPERS